MPLHIVSGVELVSGWKPLRLQEHAAYLGNNDVFGQKVNMLENYDNDIL